MCTFVAKTTAMLLVIPIHSQKGTVICRRAIECAKDVECLLRNSLTGSIPMEEVGSFGLGNGRATPLVAKDEEERGHDDFYRKECQRQKWVYSKY